MTLTLRLTLHLIAALSCDVLLMSVYLHKALPVVPATFTLIPPHSTLHSWPQV